MFIDDELTGIALWGAIPGAMIGVFFVMVTGTEFKSIFKVLSVVVVGFVIYKMVGKMNNTASDVAEIRESKLVK